MAIKVLRAELAAVIGAERFLSEIKTTANLQHPHILPLHDSGEADSFLFYVMPFVEGESLRDRLTREKQLPIADAVRIATEVASALDYAHRHNVIHRDIKPENILLHEGRALIADFGIALAASKAGGTRMTETGMSLGTPHYMSPEQAMGERDITARSDVYALGCVTYEMLCGEPPFSGPTAQSIVAKVLTEEPRPLIPKRHTIPPHVEAAVLHALEKLPADRFATAAEFAAALVDEHYHGTTTTVVTSAAGRASGRLGDSLFSWWSRGRGTRRGRMSRWRDVPSPAPSFDMDWRSPTPRPRTRAGWRFPRPTVLGSPTSDRQRWGTSQLWIKRRDRYEAAPLAGTGGVRNFTWSPDGQWIAYTFQQYLKKIPISGGAAITLTDSASGGNPGMAWLDDGTIVYLPVGGGRGLRRMLGQWGNTDRLARRHLALGVAFGSPRRPRSPVHDGAPRPVHCKRTSGWLTCVPVPPMRSSPARPRARMLRLDTSCTSGGMGRCWRSGSTCGHCSPRARRSPFWKAFR